MDDVKDDDDDGFVDDDDDDGFDDANDDGGFDDEDGNAALGFGGRAGLAERGSWGGLAELLATVVNDDDGDVDDDDDDDDDDVVQFVVDEVGHVAPTTWPPATRPRPGKTVVLDSSCCCPVSVICLFFFLS